MTFSDISDSRMLCSDDQSQRRCGHTWLTGTRRRNAAPTWPAFDRRTRPPNCAFAVARTRWATVLGYTDAISRALPISSFQSTVSRCSCTAASGISIRGAEGQCFQRHGRIIGCPSSNATESATRPHAPSSRQLVGRWLSCGNALSKAMLERGLRLQAF